MNHVVEVQNGNDIVQVIHRGNDTVKITKIIIL